MSQDTITNSLEMDGLIAGDFPRALDVATIKLGQNLERGSVIAPEDGTAATKTSTASAPYNMESGQSVEIDVDNAGAQTATFLATAATIVDTTSYPCANQDGLYIDVTITGGPYDGEVQRITFAGIVTTSLQVAAEINNKIKGAKATAGVQVTITTDGKGTDYDIAVSVGTSGLTFASSTAGTGNVGNIDEVDVTEVKTVLEAAIPGMTVSPSGDTFKIDSDSVGVTSELHFLANGGLIPLGLTPEVINGTSGSGDWILCDKDAETGAQDPAGVLGADTDASAAATNAPIYRTGEFDAEKLIFESGTVAADMKEAMAAKSMFQKTTSNMV